MDVNGSSMRVLPFAEVREILVELVDAVSQMMGRILIVADDAPVAVLIGVDEGRHVENVAVDGYLWECGVGRRGAS